MKKQEPETRQQTTYQTGNVTPPKNHQGLVAVLLILVIFLGGIVSGLGMMNIRLFRLLEQQNQETVDVPVQFSRASDAAPAAEGLWNQVELPQLGLTGQEVTDLCRSYYGWPEGLYVSSVAAQSPAETAGIQFGDILVAVNGTPIANIRQLQQLLADAQPGQDYSFTVYRSGRQMKLHLTPQ